MPKLDKARELLRELVRHHDALAGYRAHRLGCDCSGGNDGAYCRTFEETFAKAKALLREIANG